MEKFTQFEGIVAPLDRANVDTDLIIPKQFLKSIKRTGFGPNLFDELRYLDEGQPGQDCSHRPINPDFVLNKPRYKGASVLLARRNFGCGSSREHAPIAIKAAGVGAVLAKDFARIFYRNSFNMGLPIYEVAETDKIDTGDELQIDTDTGVVTNLTKNETYNFKPIPPFMQELIEAGGLIPYAQKEMGLA